MGESEEGLVEDQERERERDCGLQVGVGDLEGLLRLITSEPINCGQLEMN